MIKQGQTADFTQQEMDRLSEFVDQYELYESKMNLKTEKKEVGKGVMENRFDRLDSFIREVKVEMMQEVSEFMNNILTCRKDIQRVKDLAEGSDLKVDKCLHTVTAMETRVAEVSSQMYSLSKTFQTIISDYKQQAADNELALKKEFRTLKVTVDDL
jgi:archaellum component FlaC